MFRPLDSHASSWVRTSLPPYASEYVLKDDVRYLDGNDSKFIFQLDQRRPWRGYSNKFPRSMRETDSDPRARCGCTSSRGYSRSQWLRRWRKCLVWHQRVLDSTIGWVQLQSDGRARQITDHIRLCRSPSLGHRRARGSCRTYQDGSALWVGKATSPLLHTRQAI